MSDYRPSFNLGEKFEVIGLIAKEGDLLTSRDGCVLKRESDGQHYEVRITSRPKVERTQHST
jgi:hypothetical protein